MTSVWATLPHDEQEGAASLDVVEGDEIFTFLGDKKTQAYVMTWVERRTRCIREDRPGRSLCLAHRVVCHRAEADLRAMVWQAMPSARQYINDAFGLYDTIGYPCEHQSLPNKKEAL